LAVIMAIACGGSIDVNGDSGPSAGSEDDATQVTDGAIEGTDRDTVVEGDAGCIPKDCSQLPCGRNDDGCGGAIDCSCLGKGQTCGGGGLPGQCGFPDAGMGRNDSGPACPSNVPLGCSCPTSYDGGVCVCACLSTPDRSMPECPADLQGGGPTWPVACDQAGSCMNCGGTAGVICTCLDAGVVGADGGGSYWQCLGTEQACTGGTFHG
jgi:hypothetical protein